MLRLITSIGELYYLALIPIVALYVGIFLSNKLYTHQQRQQQRRPSLRFPTLHARPRTTPSPPSPLLSSSLPVPPDGEQPDAVDPAAPLPLQFLLPDQTLITHTMASSMESIASVLSTLYPARSLLRSSTRLIYQGRIMQPDTLLMDYCPHPNDIIHVHHVHAPAPPTPSLLPTASPSPLLLVPLTLLTLLTGAAWGVFLTIGHRWCETQHALALMLLTLMTGLGVWYGHATQRQTVS